MKRYRRWGFACILSLSLLGYQVHSQAQTLSGDTTRLNIPQADTARLQLTPELLNDKAEKRSHWWAAGAIVLLTLGVYLLYNVRSE